MVKASQYSYKLPEGFELKEQHRPHLDRLIDELGLSNERAQQLIDLHVMITEDNFKEWYALTRKAVVVIKIGYFIAGAVLASLICVLL